MKNPLLKNGLKEILNGILAGLCIAIGGSVYLSCDNKYIGATFFAVALLCICYMSFNLYTGKIGFMAYDIKINAVSTLFSGLLGNAIATIGLGFAISFAIAQIGEKANAICLLKLEQPFLSTLIRSILCGVLMFLAVKIFKEHKTPLGIIFCIPVFILSGFEHSVANMFYFAASSIFELKAFGYIWTCILGNSLGALIIPLIQKITLKKEKTDEQN